ncbi:MAG: hypothetical protein ABL982_19925 [Vicinamibacterales bacterium]
MIDAYIKDRREVPLPSAGPSSCRVALPAMVDAKVALYRSMREARVNKSELARRLDVHLPQVDRLLAIRHASKLEALEGAFRALGKRLVVGVENVAPPRMAAARPVVSASRRANGVKR